MALDTRHIIQKQLLEVEMENPADAFEFRNRLGEVFHEKILPRLESLFDEYGNDVLIRMDNLQIDVGNIDAANWENELAEKSVNKIKQALLLENPLRISSSSVNIPVHDQRFSSKKKESASNEKYATGQFPGILYLAAHLKRLRGRDNGLSCATTQ